MMKHSYVWACPVTVVRFHDSDAHMENETIVSYPSVLQRLARAVKADVVDFDLVQFLDDAKLTAIVTSILPLFDVSSMQLRVHVAALKPLSQRDIRELEDYIQGQLSDGWGEGFEQVPFYSTKRHEYYMQMHWKDVALLDISADEK